MKNGRKRLAIKKILKHYEKVVNTINQQLATLNGKNPDIKLFNDILITAFLGGICIGEGS